MPFHIFILLVHLEARCHELPDFFAMSLLWGLRKQDKNLISFAEAGPKTINEALSKEVWWFPQEKWKINPKRPICRCNWFRFPTNLCDARQLSCTNARMFCSFPHFSLLKKKKQRGQFAPKVYSGATRLEVSKLGKRFTVLVVGLRKVSFLVGNLLFDV